MTKGHGQNRSGKYYGNQQGQGTAGQNWTDKVVTYLRELHF